MSLERLYHITDLQCRKYQDEDHRSGRLGEYLNRLEATGRHEGAEELRRRHPKEVNKKKIIPHIPPAIARNAH